MKEKNQDKNSRSDIEIIKWIAYTIGSIQVIIGICLGFGLLLSMIVGMCIIILGYFVGKRNLIALILLAVLFGLEKK